MPVRKIVNHIPPSPVKVNLEEESLMKQGIVTILRSDSDAGKGGGAASIRRTLSADMSSKKWLHQNGFLSPMKKIVSSEALVVHPTTDDDEKIPNQDDVWRSIQAQKEVKEIQKPPQIQVWGSILTQKNENSALPPPYVHPLVKRSGSALSGKSLEICTEGLGSETGSDCFSSTCSEIVSDADEDKQVVVTVAEEYKDSNPFSDFHVAKYRKSPARPFPPPLPSIAGGDGASLHMQSHRENGRLVLEAVSVPPRNYFHAQRQDGRLLLTLLHRPASCSDEDDNKEEVEKVFDVETHEEEVEEEKKEEEEVVEEEKLLSLQSGMIKLHKSGLVMKKLVANVNPTWPKGTKKGDEEEEEEEEEEFQIPQSLPPRVGRFIPAPPASASFNVYEYFWRNKTGGFLNPMITNKMNGTATKGYHQENKANKTEQFVPYLRGCKEARRTLAIPEPSCWIATS